jgi:hypothetical protein
MTGWVSDWSGIASLSLRLCGLANPLGPPEVKTRTYSFAKRFRGDARRRRLMTAARSGCRNTHGSCCSTTIRPALRSHKGRIEIANRMPLQAPINADNRRYMTAKAARVGHRFDHLTASLADQTSPSHVVEPYALPVS